MRNHIIAFGVAALMVGGAACAYNPPPVPVYASRADWEILAGHWTGTYTTSSTGRRGVIEFTLSAGDEQAFGDVLMFADGCPIVAQRRTEGESCEHDSWS